MFLVRTITGRSLQWLFVLALLLISTGAWSRTAEALPRYDLCVNSARSPAEVAKIDLTIRDFFEALRRDDKVAFQRLTTRSFYSFDGGKRFAGGELLEMVRDMHARGVRLNWSIGTIDIHLGCNMAWTAWENSGSAGVSTNLRPVRWLQAAGTLSKPAHSIFVQVRIRRSNSKRADASKWRKPWQWL